MSLSPAIVLRNVPANTPSAPLVHAHRRFVPDNTMPSLGPVSGTTPKRGNDPATGATAAHPSNHEIRGPGHEYFSSPRKCDDRKPLLAPHGRPYGSPAPTGLRSPMPAPPGRSRRRVQNLVDPCRLTNPDTDNLLALRTDEQVFGVDGLDLPPVNHLQFLLTMWTKGIVFNLARCEFCSHLIISRW
jgi:hypothetical protein